MSAEFPERSSVTLSAFDELVAAVPALLGFYPCDSLVVIAVRERQVVCSARVDLSVARSSATELCERMRASLRSEQLTGLVLVVVTSGSETSEPPPEAEVVNAVRDGFERRGLPVKHCLWTAAIRQGAQWRCYHHPDCSGFVADPGSSPLAAAAVLAGKAAYVSREDLAASLAPADEGVLVRRGAEILAAALRDDGQQREPAALLRLVDSAIED
uniref:DUF4192 domain-containing protein n=2 Tax=Amycolatopsis TaxID=1813 RepID=UPI003EBAB976